MEEARWRRGVLVVELDCHVDEDLDYLIAPVLDVYFLEHSSRKSNSEDSSKTVDAKADGKYDELRSQVFESRAGEQAGECGGKVGGSLEGQHHDEGREASKDEGNPKLHWVAIVHREKDGVEY